MPIGAVDITASRVDAGGGRGWLTLRIGFHRSWVDWCGPVRGTWPV